MCGRWWGGVATWSLLLSAAAMWCLLPRPPALRCGLTCGLFPPTPNTAPGYDLDPLHHAAALHDTIVPLLALIVVLLAPCVSGRLQRSLLPVRWSAIAGVLQQAWKRGRIQNDMLIEAVCCVYRCEGHPRCCQPGLITGCSPHGRPGIEA